MFSNGKIAVITGAAGGLGSALSRKFAEQGFAVFLTDIRSPELQRVIADIREAGGNADGCVADISRPEAIRTMVDQAVQAFGSITTLINNAAVSSAKSIWDIDEADWDYVLNVNVRGLFFALQSVARHMRERGGSIINIASVAGRAGRPALLGYAASKAAVISITRSAALALAQYDIRVNAIAPGMIDTEMLHDLQNSLSADTSPGNPMKTVAIPLGRIARPEDIVGTALFLAGEGALYITGQTLNVDGGIVMS